MDENEKTRKKKYLNDLEKYVEEEYQEPDMQLGDYLLLKEFERNKSAEGLVEENEIKKTKPSKEKEK